MSDDSFKDKFIAYVDILGFKNMVEAAEARAGLSGSNLREICAALGTSEDQANITNYGPTICPESARIRRDIDFQLTQVSDYIIVSAEISPAGVINLVQHCWGAAIKLLTKGVMVRGYVTRGSIFHEGSDFMGTGYHKAYDKERNVTAFKQEADERGTPFIEVDPVVCDYVSDHSDECVREMFSRMVLGDEVVTALFPFKRLSHSFLIGSDFDPAKEKKANQVLSEMIQELKQRVMSHVDESNLGGMKKARHYIRALDDQLAVCDRTDETIDMLCAPYPAHRMGDLKPPKN